MLADSIDLMVSSGIRINKDSENLSCRNFRRLWEAFDSLASTKAFLDLIPCTSLLMTICKTLSDYVLIDSSNLEIPEEVSIALNIACKVVHKLDSSKTAIFIEYGTLNALVAIAVNDSYLPFSFQNLSILNHLARVNTNVSSILSSSDLFVDYLFDRMPSWILEYKSFSATILPTVIVLFANLCRNVTFRSRIHAQMVYSFLRFLQETSEAKIGCSSINIVLFAMMCIIEAILPGLLISDTQECIDLVAKTVLIVLEVNLKSNDLLVVEKSYSLLLLLLSHSTAHKLSDEAYKNIILRSLHRFSPLLPEATQYYSTSSEGVDSKQTLLFTQACHKSLRLAERILSRGPICILRNNEDFVQDLFLILSAAPRTMLVDRYATSFTSVIMTYVYTLTGLGYRVCYLQLSSCSNL